ncbi:hypothetical protein AHAS_Ahas20G0237400 [Arachis hypogaea]
MTSYDGTSDPNHHLSNFRSRMYLTDTLDVVRCKAFPTTLTKAAIKWFDSLPPKSITSFDDLAKKFFVRFSIQKDKAKHAPSLLGIKQGERESLHNYIKRFNKACMDIQSLLINPYFMIYLVLNLSVFINSSPTYSDKLQGFTFPSLFYDIFEKHVSYALKTLNLIILYYHSMP